MKKASIIKNETHYWIYSQYRTVDGLWIAAFPFVKMAINVSLEHLIDTLLTALNISKQNVPHPKDWKAFGRDFLNGFETKSLNIIFRDAVQCEVSLKEKIISFLPTKNIGGKGRFDHLPDLTVNVSSFESDQEIYNALEDAFSKCS